MIDNDSDFLNGFCRGTFIGRRDGFKKSSVPNKTWQKNQKPCLPAFCNILCDFFKCIIQQTELASFNCAVVKSQRSDDSTQRGPCKFESHNCDYAAVGQLLQHAWRNFLLTTFSLSFPATSSTLSSLYLVSLDE